MTVGVFEFDEISYLPFETFLAAARPPVHVIGRKLGFPLGKRVAPADVEANVTEHRRGRRARGQAIPIAIDPRVCNRSFGRVGGRKTKNLPSETPECFAIRH